MSRQAHLIGSIGLENAETAMTKAAEILGPRCSRIPDGETSERGYWIPVSYTHLTLPTTPYE